MANDRVSPAVAQVIISKTVIFLSLKINFVLSNSADPDEMPP